MKITIREFEPADITDMCRIWDSVVEDANAFPQNNQLDAVTGAEFFAKQTFTGVAVDELSGDIVGLYILHPNNVGRCSHICNASYAVRKDRRGQGIGEALVRHSLKKGKERGFRIMQFNAVTSANKGAQALYEKIGFTRIGTIPGGFLLPDGSYDDIILYYFVL